MKKKKLVEQRKIYEDTFYVSCECGSEILRVDSDVDKLSEYNKLPNISDGILVTVENMFLTDDNKYDYYSQEFWFSLYDIGQYKSKPSLWWRIKRSLEFIRKGEFTSDSIVLSRQSVKELIKHLQEKLDKYK